MDMSGTATHDPEPAAPSQFALQASKAQTHPVKIDIKNLKFFYANGFEALHGIDLSLLDKTVTSFIGPSGCGKSTLLRVLNRM